MRIRSGLLIVAGTLLVLTAATAVTARQVYQSNLKPLSSSEKIELIEIPSGSTAQEIADQLEEKRVIRKSWAFQWYVRNSGARSKLQAGTYALRPNQSVQDIVKILTSGAVASDKFTILPNKRLDQIKAAFINAGFAPDKVEAALEPGQYENHPALSDKPKGASLEGYLYPETFQKNSKTTPQQIVRLSLDQMQLHLTPSLRRRFVKQGFTVHQAVTLASVIESEVGTPKDRQQVSQVFLKRLSINMALQSDVTVHYGRVVDDESYNTYSNKGLPAGPISNVSASSLEAVASPASGDYLYFVAGDNGVTYFSKTAEEHQKAVRDHCSKERCPAQ